MIAQLSGASVAGLLLAHLAGDYVLQSHWMATRKTQAWVPAIAHAAVYTACYLPVTRSVLGLAVIGGTHAVIDRYRLARQLVWVKNHLAPASARPPVWAACSATGYSPEFPTGLAIGLLIAADNTLHLIINTLAVMWL
ncbi:MAG TPA: DUF3307 domain-containing protein [Kineosporiaceae bacterium]|nr:DUF3307 domain-containing protein [Kineosporiaceae bacterium]